MAEIRLICPGCAAEYRVPAGAIPPDGREVECSACGNVWHALPRPVPSDFPARTPAEPPADLPRLNRPLPDSVLDILRDEVEHERRARAAEEGEAPAAPAPRPAPDPEWPATTITRHFDPKPAEPAQPQPAIAEPAPEPAQPVTVQTARAQTAPVQNAPVQPAPAQTAPMQPIPPAAPDGGDTATAPVPRASPVPPRIHRRGGYGAGVGLAVMLAAGVAVLYLLAPRLADQGAFGESLVDLRAHLDQARLWLQDRAAGLIR